MGRLVRWIINGLTALSLLLCATAVCMWVRSYHVLESLDIGEDRISARGAELRDDSVFSGLGRFGACRWLYIDPMRRDHGVPPVARNHSSTVHRSSASPPASTMMYWRGWDWLGFDGQWTTEQRPVPRQTYAATLTKWRIVCPYWFVVLATLPLPGVQARNWRRRRVRARIQRGLCSACGYDLRAHNPGDRCPECGTVKGAR